MLNTMCASECMDLKVKVVCETEIVGVLLEQKVPACSRMIQSPF